MSQQRQLRECYKVINLESALKLDEFLYEKHKKVDMLLVIEFMRRGYDITTLYSMKKYKEESEKKIKNCKFLKNRSECNTEKNQFWIANKNY